jgi:hypothetical protein
MSELDTYDELKYTKNNCNAYSGNGYKPVKSSVAIRKRNDNFFIIKISLPDTIFPEIIAYYKEDIEKKNIFIIEGYSHTPFTSLKDVLMIWVSSGMLHISHVNDIIQKFNKLDKSL